MKSFKNYISEGRLPKAKAGWKVYHHKVEQYSERDPNQAPEEDEIFGSFLVPSRYEDGYTHDMVYVALPENDVARRDSILARRFKKFHLTTMLTHQFNYPEDSNFGVTNDDEGNLIIGTHYHGDGGTADEPCCGHAYKHVLEEV